MIATSSIFPARRVRILVPALLAAIAWLAVLLQLYLSVVRALGNGKSAIDGIVVYLGFFTVLTNIFVALVASAGALGKGDPPAPRLYRPPVVGCATTAILLVGIVYHFVLRHVWSPQGAQWVADALLHYVVPAGALLHWLAYREAGRIGWPAPLAWCIYPAAYFAYALARGAILGSYPYSFVNAATLGYPRVLANALGLLAGFLILGYAVVGVARLMAGGRAR